MGFLHDKKKTTPIADLAFYISKVLTISKRESISKDLITIYNKKKNSKLIKLLFNSRFVFMLLFTLLGFFDLQKIDSR